MQREELINRYQELETKEKDLINEKETLEASLPDEFVKAVKDHKGKLPKNTNGRRRGRPKKGESTFEQKVAQIIDSKPSSTLSVRDIAVKLSVDTDEYYLRKIRHICFKMVGTKLELPIGYKPKSFSLDAQLKIK